MIQGRAVFLVLATAPLMLLHAPARGDEVPKGEILHFVFDHSQIFPGTVRDYWVYVPRQYDPAKPACLYVNQDGIQYKAPAVFDELIHKKEMPVTIGVFVMHGRVKAHRPEALDRFNRSYRVRRPGRQLRRGSCSRSCCRRSRTQDHSRRPADPAFARRQRPGHRRLQQRRGLRLHGGLGAARRVPPRVQLHRHLRRPARRQRLPDA